MSYTAGTVMDGAAALLNDAARTLYSYTVQLPYLKIAQQSLEQNLILNEVPLAFISEYDVDVPAGDINPSLPTDFFIPMTLLERGQSQTLNSNYTPMTEVPDVGKLTVDPGQSLIYWDWRHNCINFIGATEIRNVRIRYWKQLSTPSSDTSALSQFQAENFLKFETAALIAKYIQKDTVRALALQMDSGVALELLIAILVKNNQGKRARRKRFNFTRNVGYYRVSIP